MVCRRRALLPTVNSQLSCAIPRCCPDYLDVRVLVWARVLRLVKEYQVELAICRVGELRSINAAATAASSSPLAKFAVWSNGIVICSVDDNLQVTCSHVKRVKRANVAVLRHGCIEIQVAGTVLNEKGINRL